MELEDAHSHLDELITCMAAGGAIDESDFAIDLGHIFAHLNRAWNGRADDGFADWATAKREQASRFPSDLEPIG